MALNTADWTVTRATKVITYIGDDHNGVAPTYATVIEAHRWLRDLQDDAEYSGLDQLDIIDKDASERSTDNIITLKNGYTITAVAAEHLYDGSINQGVVGVDRIEYDGFVNFGNQGVMIQVHQAGAVLADDFWNYAKGGADDTSSAAAFLTDGGETWTVDEWVGFTIYNTTDGSFGLITENTGTTITADMQGGTLDTWESGDAYLIAKGLNASAAGGISHRFLLKVHDFGVDGGDIDYRKLVGTSRRWSKTYGEFTIPASANGNNVFALSDSDDLNNTTAYNTVETWTTIVNETEGFVQIDVNDNGTPEDYYSEWNRAAYDINQFYERMKWITGDGTTELNYDISGELFRGITHELDVNGGGGTWGSAAGNLQAEEITWGTGATAGVGQLMAVDNETGTGTTIIWFQLLSGVVPADDLVITGTDSTATAIADLTTGSLTPRPLSTPFVGVSTGSALIGSYGMSLEKLDLSSNDKVFDLTNTAVQPPNTVTFTVSGLISGEDYVLVTEDSAGINFSQMVTDALLDQAGTTEVSVGAIPIDCPVPGTIRIERDDGLYSRHPFSARNLSTDVFTITSHSFVSNEAQIGNNVFISYLDKLADATSLNFAYVYNAPRTHFVRVLDGGTAGDFEGTKTTETTGVMGTNGGSVNISRISDV
jgi:hypothetical protein